MSEIKETTGVVKTLLLHKLRYGMQSIVGGDSLVRGGNKLKVDVEYIGENMVIGMSKEVYGIRKLTAVSKKIDIPATWREHLKKRLGFEYKKESIDVSIDVDIRAHFPEVKGEGEVVHYILKKR